MTLDQLINTGGWTLLHSLWQFAAIAILLGVATRVVAMGRCQVRYVLTCAALLLMIAAMAGTFVWQINAPILTATSQELQADGTEQSDVSSVSLESAAAVAAKNILGPISAATTPIHNETPAVEAAPLRARIETLLAPWIGHVVALWMLGVSLLSLRLCVNWRAVRRLRSSGSEIAEPTWTRTLARIETRLKVMRPVALLQSSAAAVPMVIGWLKPVVLVPMELVTGLTTAEIEAILAHELAHIRRHDYLVNLLQNVAETLLFYHPAVWWVSRRIRQEREFCCDDIAAELCDGTAAYARALATVETMRSLPPALSVAANGGSLLERIRRLAGREPQQAVGASGAMTAALVLSCAMVLLTGTLGRSADEVEAAKETEANAAVADTIRVRGRVVDASGEPVPDALVTFPFFVKYQKQSVISHTTKDGAFTLNIPSLRERKNMVHAWAYAKGHGIRAVNLAPLMRGSDELEGIELQLPPAEALSYRVLLPDGAPCVGATVCPFGVQVPNGVFAADESTGLGHWLPDDIAKLISNASDDKGEVTFSAIPKALVDTIAVTTPELGEQRFTELEGDLQLSEVGSIQGEVIAENVEGLAGTKFFITTDTGGDRREGHATVELDEAGKFSVSAIATGRLDVRTSWPSERADLPYCDSNSEELQRDQALIVQIETCPAVTLKGQILTEDTRKPVRNAETFIRNLTSPDFGQHVKSDSEGYFEAKAFAGAIHFQVVSLGDDESV